MEGRGRPSIVSRIMLRLQTTFFLITLVVGIFAITPAIPGVVKDISTQVTKLDNAITAFSSSNTYMDAFAIHRNVPNLVSAANQATELLNDIKPISADDAHAILDGIEALIPTILHAMKQLSLNHAAFKNQPIYSLFPGIPGLVTQDLNSVQGSTSSLLATIVAFVPADMVSRAKSIQGSINGAVAQAIIACS